MAASVNQQLVKTLPNFRRVFPREIDNDASEFITGQLFRSSRPDLLDETSANFIPESGIKAIIDLRHVSEYLKVKGDKYVDKHYKILYTPTLPYRVRYQIDETIKLKVAKSKRHELDSRKTSINGIHLCLDFFRMNYVLALLRRVSIKLLLQSLLYLIIDICSCNSSYYRNFVSFFSGRILNIAGLADQYKNMIELSQASICIALKTLTNPENLPALIICAHGKDRTGVLVAIILTIMGVPREEIIEDYTKSEAGLACMRERHYHEVCVRYNLSEDFLWAKPDNMRQMLEYIDDKYGSMDSYLDYIGFGPTERQKLRDNLNAA